MLVVEVVAEGWGLQEGFDSIEKKIADLQGQRSLAEVRKACEEPD